MQIQGQYHYQNATQTYSYIILEENKIILKDVDGKVIQEYQYEK